MKRDKATYILKEVYSELSAEYPQLTLDIYRDGGSVAFGFATSAHEYRNIVLIAPVATYPISSKPKRVEFRISCAQVLVPGCIRFEDSYKRKNILGTVTMYECQEQAGQEAEIKRKIKELVVKRLKMQL